MRGLARLICLAAVLVAALTVGAAQGASVRVTKGDAEAVFNAFGNGGWAIIQNKAVQISGPGDGLPTSLAVIRPLPAYNGKHYCALDWHTIALAIFTGGDASYQMPDFEAYRSQTTIALTLDGQPFASEETASKRFLRELIGFENLYYWQTGRVLAPDELAVGAHTLREEFTDPSGSFTGQITFYIDPAGAGTCL